MNIQLRKLHLLIQHFTILQLRHASFITQSLKEIHSGREKGLIDTGPLLTVIFFLVCLVDEGIEDPNTTINASSSAHRRNAI